MKKYTFLIKYIIKIKKNLKNESITWKTTKE